MGFIFITFLFQRSVTDDELAEITRKRRNTEMTVADIIQLTKD